MAYESQLEGNAQIHINNSVGTIVNICTILSKANEHKKALSFARQAIKKLNITVRDAQIFIGDERADMNIAATSVIAHFNAAVEAEHLSLWQEAKDYYEKSLQLSKLGPEQARD